MGGRFSIFCGKPAIHTHSYSGCLAGGSRSSNNETTYFLFPFVFSILYKTWKTSCYKTNDYYWWEAINQSTTNVIISHVIYVYMYIYILLSIIINMKKTSTTQHLYTTEWTHTIVTSLGAVRGKSSLGIYIKREGREERGRGWGGGGGKDTIIIIIMTDAVIKYIPV